MYYLQKTQFNPKDTKKLKVKCWKKIYPVHTNGKKAAVALLIPKQTLNPTA